MREKDIVKNIQNGEMECVEQIVSAYYGEIYSYLCRKLGNEVEAQDVTQEVFVKFFVNIHNYQERGKLRNYLFKLATNASNDVFRKSKQMHSLDMVGDLPDRKLTPWELTEKAEEKEQVKDALQTLSIQQREVIILRFYHELSFLDIARITGNNLSTVKTRYRRGMAALKKILEVEHENR